MALLYRLVKINDRGNTRVFSFVVTKTVTRDLHRDLTTKEFPYGFNKWAVAFSRTEKQLGVYLVWRTTSEHVTLFIDFAFSLLNREHFSGNESFSGKQIKFSKGSPAQGNRKFITIVNLCERKFTDVNGEFQLELTMTNLRTLVESSWSTAGPMETGNFRYGGFDWRVSVQQEEEEDRVVVTPRRLSGFEHMCRLRYSVLLGEPAVQSGLLEETSDLRGLTAGWTTRSNISRLLSADSRLKLSCDLSAATAVSELALSVSDQADLTPCRDRDMQCWGVQADTHGQSLRLRVVYRDIHNIPRNHLKHATWNLYMIRRHPKGGTMSPSLVQGGPFGGYYVQEEHDEGVLVDTDVAVQELRSPGTLYLDDQRHLTVQVEWLETALLFQSTYHKYDDISRAHNFQMRREISALQTENYSLERQLFSYQKSIAFANSRGTYSNELPSPDEEPSAAAQLMVDSCANGAGATHSYARQLHGPDYNQQRPPDAPYSDSCLTDDNDYNA